MTGGGGAPGRGAQGKRYSRLAGVGWDVARLRGARVAVVGVGGLGVVALDELARLGTGTLQFFDMDTLGEENLNRSVFLPRQVGMRKVNAMAEYLASVNAEVRLLPSFCDITDGDGLKAFREGVRLADVVLGCVDSPHARSFINGTAVAARKPYVDGGAREDGLSGAVVTVVPGVTPCYRCNKPVFSDAPPARRPEGSGGMCFAASMPTTMAIVASLQVQETARLLCGGGDPIPLLVYRGLEGTVESVSVGRDPNCPACGGLGR